MHMHFTNFAEMPKKKLIKVEVGERASNLISDSFFLYLEIRLCMGKVEVLYAGRDGSGFGI